MDFNELYAGNGGRSKNVQDDPMPEKVSSKDDRPLSVHEQSVLDIQLDRIRQDLTFKVPAFHGQVLGSSLDSQYKNI